MKTKNINKHKIRIIKETATYSSMTIPAVILVFLFSYLPMFGIIMAFKDYSAPKGIWGSDWKEPLFGNFLYLVQTNTMWRVVRNTLGLNFLFIAVALFCNVTFALILFEVKKAIHIKAYQSFAILPSLISWVAVSYIVYGLLDGQKGILNQIITFFGGEGINWYGEPKYWPVILTVVKEWKGVGMGCILYYAALMGIDSALFEAADIDGASKFQKTIHVSVPHLVPVMVIKTILAIGGIFRADFGLFYNVTLNQGVLYPVTDVMDTFVMRAMTGGSIGMSSAGAFVQSVVCTITVVAANSVVKKIQPEYTLF